MSGNEVNEISPECKYGDKCYRKNPQHLAEYSHPARFDDSQVKRKSDEEDEPESKKLRSLSPKTSPRKECSDDDKDEDTDMSDEEEVPFADSPQLPAESILQKYLVEMPPDFYHFWKFCEKLKSNQPQCALLADLDLKLVGPYDVLSGQQKSTNKLPSQYLISYRYYYDPPEFQTVLQGDKETQYHIGYFRDDPSEMPVFLAENEAKKNGLITPIGDNIFAAVYIFLKEKLNSKRNDNGNLKKLEASLVEWAKDHKLSLEKKSAKMKTRDKKVVTKCFHKAGMVVPLDKKTEIGYRPLAENDTNLRKMLQNIVDAKTKEEREKKFYSLQQLMTFAQIANDECDFGNGLELALNLFTFGHPSFHSYILSMMPMSYELLGRTQFAKIAKAHLKNRAETIA